MTITRPAVRERPPRPSPALRRPAGLTDRQLGVLTPVILIAIIGLAIQIPRYAHNIAPSDVPIVLFLVVGAASFWRSRVRLRLPLAAGFLLMLVGGSLAVTQSVVPRDSASALVQDVYLFIAFLLATNLIARAPEKLARRS